MENASNALIIAAGVLLSVMILALVVYLFISFGSSASEAHDRIARQQMVQFNAQFAIYANRNDIKIHDIITVANLAKENNKLYEANSDDVFINEYKITIDVKTVEGNHIVIPNSINQYDGIDELNNRISNDIQVDGNGDIVNIYQSEDIEYHDNGRVSKLIFKPKT